MRLLSTMTCLTLLLAGCDKAPAPPANSTAPAGESGYIAKVRALPPGQRNIVLFRAIAQGGGGGQCQGIKTVEDAAADASGEPAWRVTCTDDSQWHVRLQDDGTALVTGARSR